MDWFRSWHGAPTDNKWMTIANRAGVEPGKVAAIFWALLDYASQRNERGSVAGFDAETYAIWSGWDEAEVMSVLSAMRAKGVITDGDTLAAWEKRQPKREDDSAERVARYRAAQRGSNAGEPTVTHSNAPEKIRLDADKEQEQQLAAATPPATPAPTVSAALDGEPLPAAPVSLTAKSLAQQPAIVAYRNVFLSYPAKAQMAQIQRHPVEDVDRWVDALNAWCKCGYSPRNIGGMLDWYDNPERMDTGNGRPSAQGGRGAPRSKVAASMDAVDQVMAMLDAQEVQ